MPITLLDGILIGFTLVSAMLAMVRGFSREVLSIASWIAAAAAAYFFYPLVLPYVTPHISKPPLAIAAAAGGVFLIALIIVTLITMRIADFIVDSRIGALDRTLGFLYGAARGLLVGAVALLFVSWLIGDPSTGKYPTWIEDAKSRPLLEDIGQRIMALLPENPDTTILDRFTGSGSQPAAVEPGESDSPPDAATSN